VTTTAFANSLISNLQLVIRHPTLKTPCLRYHEPWPATRTKFDPTDVSINGTDEEKAVQLTDWINTLLYDRRVCYYHEWVEGDLLLSDNISMMHTRTGFTAGAPRELWRIHID
jgi:alpha-ketoglutarate-dependent taurine dioxygenase